MGEKLHIAGSDRHRHRGARRVAGAGAPARAAARAEEALRPTELGRLIDDCQRLAGLDGDSEAWRRELSALVERIPPHLTEPEIVVAQGVLWRVLMHAAAAGNGCDRSHLPIDAVRAFAAGDLGRALSDLLNGGERRPSGARADTDPRIDRALRYVTDNHANPRLNLAGVAAHVNLSRWHFDRLLKRRTGLGFRGHLTAARMVKARELLEGTSLEIKEVSARVGYKQTSEFDRHFRRSFGITPTRFRNAAADGGPRSNQR